MCLERAELRERIVDGLPDIMAEVVVAARFEQARHIDDVFLRRTRLGLLAGRRIAADPKAVKKVAKLMGSELGWGMRQTRREIEAWGIEAEAEGAIAGEAVSSELRPI
jgi:glycerol-3-phosphate dehydrogenase